MIQLQMLNRILQSGNTSLLTLHNFTEEYFSDYKKEYNWISEHIKKYGNCPDTVSFLDQFPSFDIIEVNETNDYLLTSLIEDFNKRKLAKVFNKVRELLNNNKTQEALNYYINAVTDVTSSTDIQSIDIIQDTSRYDTYIDKCNDYNKFYIKTGFDELDTLIGGWDKQEELATLVARPGVGKSFCLQKIAIAAAQQGLTVGIYSGEMSEAKVGYRIDTLISHIPNSGIMRGDPNIKTEYKRYLEGLKDTIKGSIKILTPSMINGPAGVNALRAFVEKDHLDMLCVDQHSLLEDDRKAKTPFERAANISRDLKNLQVLKKIPIIAISQQNRTEAQEQNTTQVAQSDRISQDSTILLFLQQKENLLTLNLVKSRDSVTGKKLNYAIDLNRGIFNFVPDSTNTDKEALKGLKEEYDSDITTCGEDIY